MALKVSPVSYSTYKKNFNQEKNSSPAFGYAFFLKGVPKVSCAYCLRPTLSIPEINYLAKTVEHSDGKYAMPIFQKFYSALDNSHKIIIDILRAEFEEKPSANVKDVVVDLSDKFEDVTNQRYASAINLALTKSQIKKGTILYRALNTIIVESQKNLLTKPDEKSGQKVLKISVLKKGVEELIHNMKVKEDEKKLKIFLKEINAEFNFIKMDPSTFFAKFGKDTMSSFLAALLAPVRATADHIVTAGSNGISDSSNYILSCGKCNWDRSDKPFKDFIDSKPEILIPNIQRQFEQLDYRLFAPVRNSKKLTDEQSLELLEYLSVVPNVIREKSGRDIEFHLPNTEHLLAMNAKK